MIEPNVGCLGPDVTADIIKTLFGVNTAEVKTVSEVPDQLFGPYFELAIGFKEEANPEHISVIILNLPFGRVVATHAEWDALQARLAEKVSAHCGFKAVPCTWDEICDYYERKHNEATKAAQDAFLASLPKEGGYEA